MTATPTEIMLRLPNEVSNQIVAFIGETPTAKLMHEKAREYNYIYGLCKNKPSVSYIHYVLWYSCAINRWTPEYDYYKMKYNFINQHILTDYGNGDYGNGDYGNGGDFDYGNGTIMDGSQYEGIFDDSDDEDENTEGLEQQEQDITIMQEEIIETDFEDLCPTIYDFYKLNMYCYEFSYTIEYFYKTWIENRNEMQDKLNTFQPMFETDWPMFETDL